MDERMSGLLAALKLHAFMVWALGCECDSLGEAIRLFRPWVHVDAYNSVMRIAYFANLACHVGLQDIGTQIWQSVVVIQGYDSDQVEANAWRFHYGLSTQEELVQIVEAVSGHLPKYDIIDREEDIEQEWRLKQ